MFHEGDLQLLKLVILQGEGFESSPPLDPQLNDLTNYKTYQYSSLYLNKKFRYPMIPSE